MLPLILAIAAADDLSPNAQALVTAVAASIEKVRAKQAALPPPKDDAERILRLGEFDEAPRDVVMTFDFSKIPEAERPRALERVSALLGPRDLEDRAELLKLLPPEGWFLKSKYGEDAALWAFQIIQHSDLATQERFLPVLERLVPSGEVDGQHYGMMYDRVEISRDRPQLFGSQFRCDAGKWRPYPIVDPEHLDERRKAFGFLQNFADYKAHMQDAPPCPQTTRPPPPGMKLD
jgi:hypothetical protein